MNIFVLDTDPKIAASMHADQHLHKMILESAQMLSTLAYYLSQEPEDNLYFTGNYYKFTHLNHPCNVWLRQYPNNAAWLLSLCDELDNIRQSLGSAEHSSMEIVRQFSSDYGHRISNSIHQFIFCGPERIKYNLSLSTVPLKYQEFYRMKLREWARAGRKMTYKNREVPAFLLEST